jgi:hypothetical protein
MRLLLELQTTCFGVPETRPSWLDSEEEVKRREDVFNKVTALANRTSRRANRMVQYLSDIARPGGSAAVTCPRWNRSSCPRSVPLHPDGRLYDSYPTVGTLPWPFPRQASSS